MSLYIYFRFLSKVCTVHYSTELWAHELGIILVRCVVMYRTVTYLSHFIILLLYKTPWHRQVYTFHEGKGALLSTYRYSTLGE